MVTTKLYPHQKQALSFLLDRERGTDPAPVKEGHPDISSNSSEEVVIVEEKLHGLWRSRRDHRNRIVGWSNVVTEAQIDGASPPPQCRGAILADDMGLGE